jgi:8-oxo-dGTP diphosphatase
MSYVEWIRSRVGHRKIFLAYTSVVLRDSQGRVLLQRRTDFDTWGLPGGILEAGEDVLTCARRELLEETGLTAGPLKLVGVYTDPQFDVIYPNGDQVQQYTLCLQGRLAGGRMLPDGVETSEQAFLDPGEIRFDRLRPYYAAMIRDALRGGEPAFTTPYAGENLVPQFETVRPWIGQGHYIGTGAAAVTVREDGRLLLIKSAEDGQWIFPGGLMRLGENVSHTAVRETAEQTGLQVSPERIIGISTQALPVLVPGGRVQPVVTLFRSRLVTGALSAGIDRAAWLSPEQVISLDRPHQLEALYKAVVAHLQAGHFLL